jgi:hypothetical protein
MTVIKFFGMLVSVAGGRVGSIVPSVSRWSKKEFAIRGVPVNNAGPRSKKKPLGRCAGRAGNKLKI